MKRPYPKYKPTDIPWLPEMPKGWDFKRAKYVFKVINERSKTGEETLLSVSEHYGVIPRDQANVNMFQAESYEGYKLCSPGDLVINSLWAWSRGLGFSEYRGIISTAYDVFRLQNKRSHNYKFFDYLLRTKAYVGEYFCRSKGIWISRLQLSTGAFLEIPIILPSFEEQQKIVDYLDHKCTLIDQFIQKKSRLIELLKEQKQAIINKAVTKGIDPNVRLKPSGIDWLGDIPAHWEVKKLSFLVKLVTSGSRGWAKYYSKKGPIFLRVGNISRGEALELHMDDVQRVQLPLVVEGSRTRIEINDILLAITGATIGSVGLIERNIEEAYVNQHVALIRSKSEVVLPKFLAYILLSHFGQIQIRLKMYGGTKEGLGLDDVRSLQVVLPTRREQEEIVEEIELELQTVNWTLEKIEREISLLHEYKTTLIAEAVTGKIDIRDWEPKGEKITTIKSHSADPV